MNNLPINQIICGDCLGVMKEFPDKSIDMILCDLPYGITVCDWDLVIPLELLWEHYKRLIKDNRSIVLTASQPFTTDLINSNRDWFKYEWIWQKNMGSGFCNAKKQPMKYHENILVFYDKQCVYNPIYEEYAESVKKRFKEGERVVSINPQQETNVYGSFKKKYYTISHARGKHPSSVQTISCVPTHHGVRLHPTQKPVKLMEYLVRLITPSNGVILDPFCGSGTTLVAAINEGFNYIGIELSQEYCNISQQRVNYAILNNKENKF